MMGHNKSRVCAGYKKYNDCRQTWIGGVKSANFFSNLELLFGANSPVLLKMVAFALSTSGNLNTISSLKDLTHLSNAVAIAFMKS